jgi:hypothetical protein
MTKDRHERAMAVLANHGGLDGVRVCLEETRRKLAARNGGWMTEISRLRYERDLFEEAVKAAMAEISPLREECDMFEEAIMEAVKLAPKLDGG